jgi:hypothetical protein
MQRALRTEVAAFTMLVDAKDERAAAFYRHHGFMPLGNESRTLFLPLSTAARLLGRLEQ